MSVQHLPAIIGGSGLLTLAGFESVEQHDIATRWGKPSCPVTRGRLAGVDILFLPRHGERHRIPPHQVNYRANIAALVELGASHVFAFNAVGGIDPALAPGSLVVPDDLIDYTWGRGHTYSDSAVAPLHHVDFTQPYDESIRQMLITAATSTGTPIHVGAVYAATQGPRLESAAEIRRLMRDGCGVVGMTGMPEAGLAREKRLPYACLALVVNPAAGTSARIITMADIEQVLVAGIPVVSRLLQVACGLCVPPDA